MLRIHRALHPFLVAGPPCRRHLTTTVPKKLYYITTPIFYPNAAPHIGHLYSLVAADVFARYQRLRGRDVRFLAGTDEHGMKIQKAALKHFGEPGREREFCDVLSERFLDLGRKANISNTCFVRTSTETHHRAVKDVWRRLYEKGFIYKGNYAGWYSVTDECFYTDAQVGPSPHDPHQTVALETGAAVEWSSEENYMFRLSAFRGALLTHVQASPTSVYPEQYREQVLGWLGAALEDISISRPSARLSWGVPVPADPGQTVYVWFDALLIYISGAGYPWTTLDGALDVQEMRARGWPADLQVVGKDILRFHAVYLPAILLALNGAPYTPDSGGAAPADGARIPIPLPRTLLAHAHWTAAQKKMSKSVGNVVDPMAAMEEWGVDAIRFYLMRIGGRWRGDVDWSAEQLAKHKHEIAAQLGNYFLRIASPRIAARAVPCAPDAQSGLPAPLQRLFGSDSSAQGLEGGEDPNYAQLAMARALPGKVARLMDTYEAGLALAEVMEVLKHANKSISEIEPWARTTPPELVHSTRLVGLETLRVVGACLAPFMPDTAARLLAALDGGDGGEQEMEAFWQRWNGREVKGVKLF
ncbi:tRNA synthetases class I (M)-domain-containing protein [Pholiota molesta]|nr:tRNA synthetases class I (M)-domain-containing protein [Pholiota molesta]